MNQWKNFFQKIYGIDGLSCGLLLLSMIFSLLAMLLPSSMMKVLNAVSLVPLFLCLWRFFSRNHQKRALENQGFMRLMRPLFEYVDRKNQEREEAQMFRFFKCPACTQKIRVPRGKGKIEITCPKCGNKFIKKT
ncbi:MAG: hypothetical protein Q4D60_06820 [Eubacteriales bacterium]|nr:hypothetical protein [Eubacteriales bacterium]